MILPEDRASFLERLGRPRPDPGGGAAAAYAALVAAALVEKVCRLEASRGQDAGVPWDAALKRIIDLQSSVSSLLEADSRAYMSLVQARAAGRGHAGLAEAVKDATSIPIRIMEACSQMLERVSEAGTHCAGHLLPDLQVAVELAFSALLGAYHIGRANLHLFPDPVTAEAYRNRLLERRQEGLRQVDAVRQALRNRTNLRRPVTSG